MGDGIVLGMNMGSADNVRVDMKRTHTLLLSLKEKVSQTRAHISSQVQADPSDRRC